MNSERIKRIVFVVCVNIVVTLVLFAGMNLAAAVYLRAKNRSRGEHAWQTSPENQEAARRAYEAAGLSQRREVLRAFPQTRLHPRLGVTSGLSTEAYRIGLESLRYEPGWDDGQVRQQLAARPAFVLGGSTVFGVGVEGDTTISAFLNRAFDTRRFLNVGVLGYDSTAELNKLLYMLRKGYRPRRVIFVDGLNDLGYAIDTTVEDHLDVGGVALRTHSPLSDIGVAGAPSASGLVRSLVYALPLYHLVVRLTRGIGAEAPSPIDPNVAPWRADLAYYMAGEVANADPQRSARRWVRYYRELIRFVGSLGRGFGFEPLFVLQPVGVGDPASHFDVPRPVWDYETGALAVVRDAIAAEELGMVDCSEVFAEDKAARAEPVYYYVDPTHYSPLGNRLVADCIRAALSQPTAPAPAPAVEGAAPLQ